MFDSDEILKQISSYGKGKKLKTARPNNGVAIYVWRMIRFHSGIDMHSPITCFFHLFDQLYAEGQVKRRCHWVIEPEHKKILDELEPIIIECSNKLKLSNFTAARRHKGILY